MLPEAQPIISLLTDFGTRDVYAGVLHGVIAGIAPRARVIDLTHEVAPQDVVEAAFLLDAAAPYFPEGTIHVGVVDPGVGSSRRILCARTRRATFLAPDNGLLTRVLERARAEDPRGPLELRAVEDRALLLPVVSSTFHGRDVFAPVAARLALGLDVRAVGPEVADPVLLRLAPDRALEPGRVRGEVVHVDRYGNLVTNLRPGALGARVRGARLGDLELETGPVRASYADVPDGAPLLITGSTGLLELAIRGGSARERLRARRGDAVELSVHESATASATAPRAASGVCP